MLLPSKLQPPTTDARAIDRPQLKLREADAPTRLTVITAPAGFGKTSLVAQALAAAQPPTAWLSLDAYDNDLARFATYLVAALQRLDPGIGGDMLAALRADHPPPPPQLAALLVSSVVSLPEGSALVLDDYHLADATDIREFMVFFVENLPSGLHLIITARHDPPFPARWRVRGWQHDLRADALRFSPAEAAAYLNGALALGLSDAEVSALVQRTEGWAAGLHLAALALKESPDRAAFIREFGGSQRFVIDYLMEEVLHHQPEPVRDFLTQTAILDRLTPALCDAVTGRDDGRAMLNHLRAVGLFTVALGGGWFRYHHLFAEVVRLADERSDDALLHQRAAAWFQANGLTEEAVQHHLAADDPDAAAACVAARVLPNIGSGDNLRLKSLVGRLPTESARRQPKLMLAEAWFATHAHRLAHASDLLDAIPSNALTADPELAAWVETVRALIVYSAGQTERVLPHIEAARATLNTPELAGMYDWLGGVALWEDGQSEAAIDHIRRSLREPSIANDPFGYCGISFFLSDYLNQMGRWHEALAVCERIMATIIDADENPLPHTAPITGKAGILHYEADDLDSAEYLLRLTLRLSEPMALTQGMVVARVHLALVAYARGQHDDAYRTLHDARHIASAAGSRPFTLMVDAVEAGLWLRDGRTDAVARWVESVPFDHPRLPFPIRAAALRALDALDDPRAGSLLDSLEAEVHHQRRDRHLIPLLVVRALRQDRAGDTASAVASLREAVGYAERGSYRRDFLDASPRVLELLQPLRQTSPVFVGGLLERVGGATPSPRPSQPLIEPLTDREIEVMRLAADGLSNREIAARLVVALSTVKTHIKHAFGKLDADSRTRAVARARSLGLLG